MPYLSRNDIEQIAACVIDQYKRTCLPEKRLCYAVDPLELAHMLGLKVVFRHLSDDGTVLGMTSPDEVCVTIFDDNMEEMMFFLDGKTILIEKKLNEHPSSIGRRNFTIAHECAHQLIYRMFPDVYGTSCRPKQHHRLFKGFALRDGRDKDMFFTQLPQSFCFHCMQTGEAEEVRNRPLRSIADKEEETCFLRGKKNVHTQLAQLVLWRDVDRANNEVKLRVSITGTSGPSTLALSTILVNESQRVRKFQLDKEILTNPQKREEVLAQNCDLCEADLLQMEKPLSSLQNEIRGKLISAFITQLDQKVTAPTTDKEKERDYCEEYAMKIKYSAVLYLTSVLYRYFLPFLSLEDEEKLLNGLRYFLFSLIASKTVSYPVVGENQELIRKKGEAKIVNAAAAALKTVLHNFKGVEALYCVKVKVKERKWQIPLMK